MNDEQKEWFKQFSSCVGVKEVFRLGAVLLLWMLLGDLLGALLNSWVVTAIFFAILFAAGPILNRWRPGYRFMRFLLGNANMPLEPMPRGGPSEPAVPRPWWSFIPAIWLWLLTILLFYLAIRYFAR